MCVLHHHVMCGRGYQKVYTSSPNVLDEKVYIYIYLFISLTKMFLYYLFILTDGSRSSRRAGFSLPQADCHSSPAAEPCPKGTATEI